jgi:inhibitor of Bruton tyrosine kinase
LLGLSGETCMNQLHAHFTLRNLQAFQRLLDSSADRGQLLSTTGISNSGGRSWSRPSALPSTTCDINARDWLGRTVLHLACAAPDQSAIEYVKLSLAHPAINVNLYDAESHWTALHRALYHGNIPAA